MTTVWQRLSKILLHVALWLFGIAVLIIGLFFGFLEILSFDNCDNEVLQRLALNSDREAVLFKRGCGATTSDSIQLSILDRGEALWDNEGGNAMAARLGSFTLERMTDGIRVVNHQGVELYRHRGAIEDIRIEIVNPPQSPNKE